MLFALFIDAHYKHTWLLIIIFIIWCFHVCWYFTTVQFSLVFIFYTGETRQKKAFLFLSKGKIPANWTLFTHNKNIFVNNKLVKGTIFKLGFFSTNKIVDFLLLFVYLSCFNNLKSLKWHILEMIMKKDDLNSLIMRNYTILILRKFLHRIRESKSFRSRISKNLMQFCIIGFSLDFCHRISKKNWNKTFFINEYNSIFQSMEIRILMKRLAVWWRKSVKNHC